MKSEILPKISGSSLHDSKSSVPSTKYRSTKIWQNSDVRSAEKNAIEVWTAWTNTESAPEKDYIFEWSEEIKEDILPVSFPVIR